MSNKVVREADEIMKAVREKDSYRNGTKEDARELLEHVMIACKEELEALEE